MLFPLRPSPRRLLLPCGLLACVFLGAGCSNDAPGAVMPPPAGPVSPPAPRGYTLVAACGVTAHDSVGRLVNRGLGLNNKGQVVGSANSSAFLWSAGKTVQLTPQPEPDSSTGEADAINDRGQVAGVDHEAVSVWSGGRWTILAGVAPTGGAVAAINERGQVAGSQQEGNDDPGRAFLWSAGKTAFLPGAGGAARGLNARGEAAGSVLVANEDEMNDHEHACVWSQGKMADLGTLGGTVSHANALNDSGEVVGQAAGADDDKHAFLYADGKMGDLGTLGGTESEAKSINSRGQIVGWSSVSGSDTGHAFLYAGGKIIDLNTLIPHSSGTVLTEATAINNWGQILANGSRGDDTQAYLLTPRP